MNDPTPWAVVLGVSSGAGEAIARAVSADPGFHIYGLHRGNYPEQAAALVDHVHGLDRRAELHLGDAGTAEGAAKGADRLLEITGPRSVKLFTHAIANASVGTLTSLNGTHLAPRQIEKTTASMAHSFVYWAQALLERDLLAPNARLIGLTNVINDSTLFATSVIGACKAALEHYVKHLAMELGPLGHRVNLVKFSTTVTPALSHVLDDEAMRRCERVHALATPAGRLLTSEEVGRLVGVLCGEDLDWFNGATIDYTGGMTHHLLELMMNPPPEMYPGGTNDPAG